MEIDNLDVLTEFDKDDFEILHEQDFTMETLNAVLYHGRWVPKSQLRCDFDNNIYIAKWLAAKL